MRMFYDVFMFSMFFISFLTNAFSQTVSYDEMRVSSLSNIELEDDDHEEVFEKIYLFPNQIIILEEGIYIILETSCTPIFVENLFSDQGGIFTVIRAQERQCKHALWCPRCKGCHPNNRCQWRCKCGQRPYDGM